MNVTEGLAMGKFAAVAVLFVSMAPAAQGGLQSALNQALWGSPVANYRAATGNITFTQLPGPVLAPYFARRIDLYGPLLVEHANRPAGITLEIVASDHIAWIGSSESFAVRFNAGNIFPPGTPAASVTVGYSSSISGAVKFFQPVVQVPEPATALMVGAGLVAGLATRRRQLSSR
jgi:hypothetical protein